MAMNKTDWFEVLNDYLYNAHNTAQVLWHWASRTGGREAYEDMFALAERLDDAEVPPGDKRWLEVLSKGQGLTAIGDRELPEIRRVAWSLCPKWSSQERHDIIRKETRRMERHLLRSKNNMERAAKILSEAGRQQNAELSLKVNGVEIKRGAPGQVIRLEKTAKSQGERPEVKMELTGPAKELVTVRFSHHYDKALKHKLEGHELCYLKSMDADCLLAENGYGEWDIDIPEEGKPVGLIFSTSGFSAVHAFNVLVNGHEIMSFNVEIDYTAYRFIEIPYEGTNYKGYGRTDASWGLPELKTFIEKFAALQVKDLKEQAAKKAIRGPIEEDIIKEREKNYGGLNYKYVATVDNLSVHEVEEAGRSLPGFTEMRAQAEPEKPPAEGKEPAGEKDYRPSIGNKSIKDGVHYRPHDGISHALGQAVDIRLRPHVTSMHIKSANYSKEKHIKQIERYFKCGANYVATSSKDVVDHFVSLGKSVDELAGHDKHDHVNVPIKQRN